MVGEKVKKVAFVGSSKKSSRIRHLLKDDDKDFKFDLFIIEESHQLNEMIPFLTENYDLILQKAKMSCNDFGKNLLSDPKTSALFDGKCLDPLFNASYELFIDRSKMLMALQEICLGNTPKSKITSLQVPRWWKLSSIKEPPAAAEKGIPSDKVLMFKSNVACSSSESHRMILATLDDLLDSLKDSTFIHDEPLIAQEFIPQKTVHKMYVLVESESDVWHIFIRQRVLRELPKVKVPFDSQKMEFEDDFGSYYFCSSSDGINRNSYHHHHHHRDKCYDDEIEFEFDFTILLGLAKSIHAKFGNCHLFGVDLLICEDDDGIKGPKVTIHPIDVNYFPSFSGLPQELVSDILKRVMKNKLLI